MTVLLNPYLTFRDSAREALAFYQAALGGEVTISTFASAGISDDPAEQDKVMHGMLTTPDGLVLMVADVPNRMELTEGSSISISLSGEDDVTLRRFWDALTQGATIVEPLMIAPWGDAFGMFTDKFGVAWMINISATAA